MLFGWTYLERLRGCCSLKQRNDRNALDVGCRDSFEVRSDAAKFRIYECVDEAQMAIEPREQAVLDAVVDRNRDLAASWADLGEINQADHFDISAC